MRTLALLAALLLPAASHAQSAQALLEFKGCLGCHAIDKQVVGPAFQQVATKYRGDSGAAAKLINELKQGEGHPMKIDASEAELKTLVNFVLAQSGGQKPAAAAKPATAPKPAAAFPTALFEANGCFGCHALDKRVVGPAFNEVAAKYRNDKAAEARLFGELKEGKGHPIKVEAPEADLRTMLKAVLASAPERQAASVQPTPAPAALDKSVCLGCHGQPGFSMPDADGNPRPLDVNADRFAHSVHGKRQCVECHTQVTEVPHKPMAQVKVSCITCHDDLWRQAQRDGTTGQHARLGVVVDQIDRYMKSIHARPSREDQSRTNATCYNCHDAHYVYPLGSQERADWRLNIPNTCGKCHYLERLAYATSVHGREVLEKKNPKAAICSDCHTTHDIDRPEKDNVRVAITKNCGSCHVASYQSYRQTYHGQVHTLGYAYTAKCFDCHGSHAVQRVSDPSSSVYPTHRLNTCRTCHADATQGFVSFEPHASTHDRSRYPYMWYTAKFMLLLITGVFLFFWTHCVLWFYREYKDRKVGKHAPRISLAGLPPQLQGKHFQRFKPVWRIAHLFFALSLMTLALTGMAAFYSETQWAQAVVHAMGGPRVAAIIHRIAGVTILTIFIGQLIHFTVRLAPRWRTFDWWGHTSLVPGPQDFKDIMAMFRWFFGMGPRPVFGRWTYWERFDYWAPFWGLFVVGASGLMMWFKELTAAVWPGWIFNVAMLAHGEEAFLAICFLFTVHFFNNHFRPDKMPPPDIVMFTGTQSLEEFAREHGKEYQELLRSGELEKHLVNPPSRAMTIGSRVLGIVLLTIGLAILALVVAGFVRSVS
ncbi:MAG TPA: cytochrome C [Burkholderiales bacterium]|nr:cytochrome C [Burkholderiales bacterium]